MMPLCGEEITSTKPWSKRLFVCIFSFIWFIYVAMCFFALAQPTIYFIYAYGTIWPICAESARIQQVDWSLACFFVADVNILSTLRP